jgi:hypothetical protein
MMKRMTIVLLGAVLLAGCSDPVAVQVTYTATGVPASDVLVQRRRPANRWDKTTNPVGTFYHPLTITEVRWTDSEGRCTLKRMGPEDSYDLVTTSSIPLTVVVGTNSISLDPGTNTNLKAWHYFARQEDGRWKITVAEPWWNWTKDKPNPAPEDTARKLADPQR